MAAPLYWRITRFCTFAHRRELVEFSYLFRFKTLNSPAVHYVRRLCKDSDQESKGLNLAKPLGSKKRKEKALPDTIKSVAQEIDAKKSQEEHGIEEEVVSAVNSVAKALGPNPETTRSDLLKKLQEYSQASPTKQDKGKSSISSMFAGMSVEKNEQSRDSLRRRGSRDDKYNGQGSSQNARPRRDLSREREDRTAFAADEWSSSNRMEDSSTRQPKRDRRADEQQPNDRRANRQQVADIRLFDGPALGIFSNKKDVADSVNAVSSEKDRPCIFDEIEREEIQHMMTMPPNNAFEEMIHWTREGKLWKFPIDNDQETDEANVGFHEHVFLDYLLEDFPKQGPIRHFMELVVVGLSKNPFLTVGEKQEHVRWFANYFKDKYQFVEQRPIASPGTAAAADNIPTAAN